MTMLKAISLIFTLLGPALAQTALETRTAFADRDFVYDFWGSPPVGSTNGGSTRAFGAKQFPASKGSNIAMSFVTLTPCGINLPHTHPRADEVLLMLEGGDLQVAFAEENPSNRTVVNVLKAGDVTIFPMGLIHFQQNLGCSNVTFMTALNNDDPGTMTIAPHMLSLPTEAIASSFNIGYEAVEQLKKNLPKNPGSGTSECMKKCFPETTAPASQAPTNSSNATRSLRA